MMIMAFSQLTHMKNSFLLAAFIIAATHAASGQQVSKINFDAVKSAIENAGTPLHYPALLQRFQAADSTLSGEDFVHLYYGQAYSKSYSPYGSTSTDFTKAYNAKDYKEAIKLGEEFLEEHPLDAKMLFKLLVCYDQTGDKAIAKKYAFRYYSLIKAIMSSGDGKSIETAYVVMAVPDEYQVLGALGLRSSKQALVGQTDVLTVTADEPADLSPYNVYFNVSQPFGHLSRQLKGKK
jgi:tetratricopeptide (TPR) repeat protein